jgi:DNA modification methylase
MFSFEVDFSTLNANESFKEDSVREVILLPFMRQLGWEESMIHRSISLKHPFLQTGSKKRKIVFIPDYVLKVDEYSAWVLDAKSPKENVTDNDNIEQVFGYANHKEIRSKYFAVSNGLEFILYKDNEVPELHFWFSEINKYEEIIRNKLSPTSFIPGKIHNLGALPETSGFKYENRPLLNEIVARKRTAKRHFGVHGYFTRQTWNVVSEYIRNYSNVGDTVLDPFGGTGVTAIEAVMLNRKGINIDINPLAHFIVDAVTTPIDNSKFEVSYKSVLDNFNKKRPKNAKEAKKILETNYYPKGLTLPDGSDVKYVHELFTDMQLSELALLRGEIMKVDDEPSRKSLLLMFSGFITKYNKTYHNSVIATKDGQGDAAPFKYYRYRIAPSPVVVDVEKYFGLRFKKIVDAKAELARGSGFSDMSKFSNILGTATNLHMIENETVDYIYTDPPYGKKIPYLDLSLMWTGWLDLPISEEMYLLEAIEGGQRNKTKIDYNNLIAKSIQEMYRVLKFDRWLSFVFAHKDPEFWHLIIETAEKAGFEYIGAVAQRNGQTSFKKRQHPFTVLAGQLIINFRKTKNPRAIMRANLGMDIDSVVMQTIEGIIAKNNGATIEQINDELIIRGLELGFLHELKKKYNDLTPVLSNSFIFNSDTKKYTMKVDTKFTSHIDISLRIRYYLVSYLQRCLNTGKVPDFDDIITNIIPLLRNGITPEDQTILTVLQEVADQRETGWVLRTSAQTSLF